MVKDTPFSFYWGGIAVGIYLFIVLMALFYFNMKDKTQVKQYVKKDQHRMQVALAGTKEKKVLKVKPKKDSKQKKPKEISKPKLRSKKSPKKVLKEKIVKKTLKKKDTNKTEPKKRNIAKKNLPKAKKTLDLFSKVKTTQKKLEINITDTALKRVPKNNLIKVKNKRLSATEKISSALKAENSLQSGEENAYFAKVQSMLEDWPAQSNFAGEKATVILYIKPSGEFEFKVKSASNIDAFNEGLIAFLEQLQSIGFGEHSGARTYEYEAEFIAKE